MNAELVAVGTEVVLGQIDNTHARFLSTDLASIGVSVYFHSAVGDNKERLAMVLRTALQRSDTVIVTGGLGPTEDDLTRETVAQVCGVPLQFSQDGFDSYVKPFFDRIGKEPTEVQKTQAMRVGTAAFLPNPRGTAPGQYLCHEGKHIFLLPGPPLEMRPMYTDYVRPQLERLAGSTVILSRVLRFFGIGESDAERQIKDLLAAQGNPTIAPLAGEGEILLRVTAKATDKEHALALIAPVEEVLLQRLGDYLYGKDDDTLPVVAQKALLEQGRTVAIAESCTGGLLTSLLVDLPGSSACLKGSVVTYSDEVKTSALGIAADVLKVHGAVSDVTVRAMAEGVRQRLRTDYGLAVTGIAGPDGGTTEKPVGLVYIGLAGDQDTVVIRRMFAGDRNQVRLRAAKAALHLLWKARMKIEGD